MSKRVLCKFYAHGACLKGEHCEYLHDSKAPANNICTFYQKGGCFYASQCRYQHVKASRLQSSASSSSTTTRASLGSDSVSLPSLPRTASTGIDQPSDVLPELPVLSETFQCPTKPGQKSRSEDPDVLEDNVLEPRIERPVDIAICSFAAAGDCPRGGKCPHMHGDLCPTCGKHCLHPFRHQEREEHTKSCAKTQKKRDLLKHSQEIECCVCLEHVLSKPTAAERKFGLLSECDHPFCLSCIRNWRSSSPSGLEVNTALRACPICRRVSYFVIPSIIWYSTKEEKQEIVGTYKAKLRLIDCKHFNFGNGNCPFGTSCFYKHERLALA